MTPLRVMTTPRYPGAGEHRAVVIESRPGKSAEDDRHLIIDSDRHLWWTRGRVEVVGLLADDGTALKRWLKDGQA